MPSQSTATMQLNKVEPKAYNGASGNRYTVYVWPWSTAYSEMESVVCWFLVREENRRKTLEAEKRTNTNSTHLWHQVWESNLGHIGGRRVLSPLRHPCLLLNRLCLGNLNGSKIMKARYCTVFQKEKLFVESHRFCTVLYRIIVGCFIFVFSLCNFCRDKWNLAYMKHANFNTWNLANHNSTGSVFLLVMLWAGKIDLDGPQLFW